ncbi:MAG: hypothetical protein IPN86_14380 [Saprospiraceae bacterium]|nr:hypothetical protein [Saprospiraceae bacterium]
MANLLQITNLMPWKTKVLSIHQLKEKSIKSRWHTYVRWRLYLFGEVVSGQDVIDKIAKSGKKTVETDLKGCQNESILKDKYHKIIDEILLFWLLLLFSLLPIAKSNF